MAEIKLTKTELRIQQNKMGQLQKYLPTLQLKKAMLQLEVNEARMELAKCEEVYGKVHGKVEGYSALVPDRSAIDFSKAVHVKKIARRYENIAGVEVPYFEGITFEDFSYSLFETPAWVDGVIVGLRGLAEAKARIDVAIEKREALEKELREVSIRVNLFEKILIPRAKANIRKIKVFLGDLQLASVSQAKVAKAKIEERNLEKKQKNLLQQEVYAH
jgi:V/A-type H+/Na+-transporting ATPase subunit D